MQDYDPNDPVIRQELESKQKQRSDQREQTYASQQVDDTFEDYKESEREPNQAAYGTIAQNPYPMGNDAYLQRQLQHDDKEKSERWRCLDIFTKLRGEDERQDFFLKVLSILTLQVLATVIFISIIYANSGIKDYLKDHLWVYFTAFGLQIIVLYAIICFRKIGKTPPYNFIALGLFTFFESIMLATLTSFFATESVFICAVMALVMFTTLVVIALVTRRSFKMVYTLMIVTFVLSLAMIPFMIFCSSRWVVILVSVVGLVLASIYVLIDIDMITEKYGLDYDDYVFASIQLYMDLVMIFVYLLQLFGDRN